MNNFSLKRDDREPATVISLKGYLDAHTAPELEETIRSLLDEGKVKIVINLNELNYISSAGLGVFMGFIEEIRDKGGDIKLAEASDKVYRVFDLLGFPMLYEILSKEEEALKRFSEMS